MVVENKLNNKFYMEADIKVEDETPELRKALASVIKLPKNKDKQPDLLYFSAIYVSSITNLNDAHFLPSELVMASDSVPSKAVDVEHKEDEIIGHIYSHAFVDNDGNSIDEKELASIELASSDSKLIHIAIAGVIYKTRFPNIAEEVAANKWKVSMECYFQDFDIKIGNMILDKKDAEALGFETSNESYFGRATKVIKKGMEIASGKAARVLRGICFSGVGIVKNPANPPSIILETANAKGRITEDGVLILDYDVITDKQSNNVTSVIIDNKNSKDTAMNKEISELNEVKEDSVGICVSYKKEVLDVTVKDQDAKVLHEDWCALFEASCTSFSRDTTDPECLRNQAKEAAKECARKLSDGKEKVDNRKVLVEGLQEIIEKAAKYL